MATREEYLAFRRYKAYIRRVEKALAGMPVFTDVKVQRHFKRSKNTVEFSIYFTYQGNALRYDCEFSLNGMNVTPATMRRILWDSMQDYLCESLPA